MWGDRDSALWHTCEIAFDLAAGHVPAPRQEVVATFPPQLHVEEQLWASGAFRMFAERSYGDGTYVRDESLFFASGRGGLTATAAVMGMRAAGNARRRREAEDAARARWVQIDHGSVYVSRYGMHLQTPRALLVWDWSSLTAARMVDAGALHFFGNGTSGPVSYVVSSDWAELAFVTWALSRHRRHPQLLDGSWLPPGWLEWCSGQKYRTRLRSPALPV